MFLKIKNNKFLLLLLKLEKERKFRKLAEKDFFNNEEYKEEYKKWEKDVSKKEEFHLLKISEEESKNSVKRAQERLEKIKEEKLRQLEELEDHKLKLHEIADIQRRSEFEQQINQIQLEEEEKLIDEEKKFQNLIFDLEEEKKLQYDLHQDLLRKDFEFNQKDQIYLKFLFI